MAIAFSGDFPVAALQYLQPFGYLHYEGLLQGNLAIEQLPR
jgi:hypothetical protein